MNLDLDAFTYITGIAGLLGLVLQIKDSFPEHRETRKTIVLLIVGIFVGSLISTLKGIKLVAETTVTPYDIVVVVLVAVLSILVMTAAFTQDIGRRNELFTATGIGTVALMVMLAAGGLGTQEEHRAERTWKQVNIDELMELSSMHASRGSYERALFFLEEAIRRLPSTDVRQKQLTDRMQELKDKQMHTK